MLLSTHIVEDVAVLCPRFAVIRKGRLVAQTSPTEARQAIDGKVFEGRLGREQMAEIQGRGLRVIQSVLVEGKNRVRVYQPDGAPPAGFEPAQANLEDAYLLLMQDSAQAPRVAGGGPGARRGRSALSLARTGVVFGEELARTFKRPLFWFLVALLALMSWGLSTGHMQIASGDSSVGGTKAWVTSEFAFARALMALMALLYGFFGSIAAGMAIVSDDEARISDMLLSTPLKPAEYVWGKFLAILAGFLGVLGLHILLAVFFNHGLPNPAALEIRGPLHLGQLPAAGPGLRPADAGLLSRRRLLPGRALAAAGHGLPLPDRRHDGSAASSSGAGRRPGSTRGSTGC